MAEEELYHICINFARDNPMIAVHSIILTRNMEANTTQPGQIENYSDSLKLPRKLYILHLDIMHYKSILNALIMPCN